MAYQASRLSADQLAPDPFSSGAGSARQHSVGPIQGVTEGASSVLNDAFDLAELQAKLCVADAKDFAQSARAAVFGLVLTLALLIAALPILAIGLSQWLAWGLQWPLWVCQLGVGGALVTCGVLAGFWCLMRLKLSLRAFASSQHEAAENIRWLRKAVSRTFPI